MALYYSLWTACPCQSKIKSFEGKTQYFNFFLLPSANLHMLNCVLIDTLWKLLPLWPRSNHFHWQNHSCPVMVVFNILSRFCTLVSITKHPKKPQNTVMCWADQETDPVVSRFNLQCISEGQEEQPSVALLFLLPLVMVTLFLNPFWLPWHSYWHSLWGLLEIHYTVGYFCPKSTKWRGDVKRMKSLLW